MSREGSRSWCYERPCYREAEATQGSSENGIPTWNGCNSWCWERPCPGNPWKRKNEESEINVIANINICQNAEANGGDGEGGDGGDGGDATGGNAIAQSAESEGDGDVSNTAIISNDEENGPYKSTGSNSAQNLTAEKLKNLLPEELQSLSQEQLQALQSLLDLNGALGIAIGDAAAVGGNATGGDGGNGGAGTGGDGGTSSNTATVNVEQVVVVIPDLYGPMPAISLGTNGTNFSRNVDIKVDENGNTFVNGQKMDEQELANGTKVFIFKNSETKESKKKGK